MQNKQCPNCGGVMTTSALKYPWYTCQSCGKRYHGIYLSIKKSPSNTSTNVPKSTQTTSFQTRLNSTHSNKNNSNSTKNTYTNLQKGGLGLIAAGILSFGLSILDGISVGYMVCSIIMCIVGAILTFIGRKKEKGEDIKIPNPFKSISHNHTNSALKATKNTKVFEYVNKNKLWLIPSVIALCVVIVFVSSAIKKSNYIKHEFAYASQAQASENYGEALYHIDNILQKDEANEKALTMKTELESLQKKQTVTNNIKDAKIYKDEGKYIEAYNKIITTLDIDPENEEALKLKDELLPLYQEQKQQQEEEKARQEAERKAEQEEKEKAEAEEKARKDAEEKAQAEAKAQQEAEEKARQEAEQKAKQESEQKAQKEAEAKANSNSTQNTQSQGEDDDYYTNRIIEMGTYVTSAVLLRSPSSYKDKVVCMSGTVVNQVSITESKLNSILKSFGIYDGNSLEEVIVQDLNGDTFALVYNPNAFTYRLLEGDIITTYGNFLGLTDITWTNIFGTQTNEKMPLVQAILLQQN